MSTTLLLIGITIIILIFVVAIYFIDKKLVKKIEIYEKRLEEKGVLKRHFISSKNKHK